MKRILLSAISALALVACGTHRSDSAVGSATAAAAPGRTAFAMPATLGAVQAAAAQSPASGFWTEINLYYSVPCLQKLETFNYNLRARADGGQDLLVSAIATRSSRVGGAMCNSIQLVTKKVLVPGVLARDSVHLVNLTGQEAALQETTKSLEAVGLKLDGVSSLCPEGAACVRGGTVVHLRTAKSFSCVDKIAPVTYSFESDDASGKVKLAVSAVNMVDSRLVACAATAKKVDITLPSVVTAQDIDLTVVGGN